MDGIMIKKIMILLITLQFAIVLAQEQNLKVQLISVQKIDADIFVGFDNMVNLYYIKDNVLLKKDGLTLKANFVKAIYLDENGETVSLTLHQNGDHEALKVE